MSGFDRLAPFYDALAWPLGAGAIRDVHRGLLDALPPASDALIVGGGTGRIAVDLLERSRARHVVYVEPSAGMIARARRRVERRGLAARVEFRQAGLEALAPRETFDLVVTPFVLDLFEPPALDAVVTRLDAALRPGGAWLFADFVLDRSGPVSRTLVAALYVFFRATCGVEAQGLPDFDTLFARRGFAIAAESRRAQGLLAARVYRRAASPWELPSRMPREHADG